jgi:hypothetical protein
MSRTRSAVLAALIGPTLALSIGCNSNATAADPSPASTIDLKSSEFESCASTANCAEPLRCFDNTCQRSSRSVVGDYYAAVGARALGAGNTDAAVAAYVEALSRYDDDKVPLPPEIDCAYGAALVQNRVRKEQAELAARVLHRCVSSVPVGASIRQQALASLAVLSELGLDPSALAKAQAADVYLTKAATTSAKITAVTISASPEPTAKSFALVLGAMNADATKSALMQCWGNYSANSKQTTLGLEVGIKAKFIAPEYEEDPARYGLSLDGKPGAGGSPEVAADACVRGALDAAIKRVSGVRDAFATKLVVRFQ